MTDKEYEDLKEAVRKAGYKVQRTNNEENRNNYEQLILKLIAADKERGYVD